MSETFKRILVTAIFLPVLIFSLMNNDLNTIYFTLIIMGIGFLGYYELKKLFAKKSMVHSFMVPLSLFGIYLALYLNKTDYVIVIFTFLFIWESLFMMMWEKHFQKAFMNIMSGLFILFYLGLMWGSSILLRRYSGIDDLSIVKVNGLSIGVYHYLIVLIGTWMCDIGAYFIGKFFGQHKLNLAVSPNKSLEGFIGGIVVSLLSIYLACFFMVISFSLWMVFIPIVTIVADLFESLIKRMVDEKDSSSLIPGHGGVLDAFDALILTTPFYYFIILKFIG